MGGTYSSGSGTTQDSSQVGKGKEGETGWSVSGWDYQKDREQIVRATVGAGEIVVRKDAETGADSTAGLNRDVGKAYEITKDEESRTDLYASSSSIDAALKPGETLKQWSDGLLNYDKTALNNFNKAASALNVMINRVDKILGRPMDARAEAVAGKDLAESTLEALILSGKSRREAMAMMGDQKFIDGVLVGIASLNGIEPKVLEEIERVVEPSNYAPSQGSLVLKETQVNPSGILELQGTLDSLAAAQKYIKENPEQAEAVGYVMAAAQGPKGVAQFLVMKAIEGTEFGKKFSENMGKAEAYAGKAAAQAIQGTELNPNHQGDAYIIGGGELIYSIFTGALPGKKGAKGEAHVSVNDGGINERGGNSAGDTGKGGAGSVDKTVHDTNTNLPVVREGKVVYEPLARPDANEIRAGSGFAKLGYDVKYKATASDLGVKDVRTPDMYVSGVGKVDVYTPNTANQKEYFKYY
nr:hypothetical protein [Pseudomonas protegens]